MQCKRSVLLAGLKKTGQNVVQMMLSVSRLLLLSVHLMYTRLGDTVLQIGIGPVGLMSVAGAALRGASRIICVGTRDVCKKAAKGYGATDFISYKDGPIEEQIMQMTNGKGVDRVCIAGGNCKTFEAAVKALKPGGKIGNVNYLGSGDYVTIPRVEWGVGMGHKDIRGGLMPGGRLRMEKLSSLVTSGRLNLAPLSTHLFNVNVWELTENCICCSGKQDFATSILTIANTIDPEFLIVEPTGVAKLSSIIENIRQIQYEKISLLQPVAVVDGNNILSLSKKYGEIFLDQIENA